MLYWGQEYRNSDPLGHMAFLNIKKQVPPSFTSVIGSNSPYDFPLNTMAALDARKQGGLVVVRASELSRRSTTSSTPIWARKEAPVTAALGAMDAIDMLPFGAAAYELWYRLLNCGFRIAPGAGTDVFTNWRGIRMIPAARASTWNRAGDQLGRWIARYREGRDFVTNGPLLTFTMNGEPMGDGDQDPGGQTYTRAAGGGDHRRASHCARWSSSRTAKSLRPRRAGGRNTFRMEKEVPVDKSCWFAVRVAGAPSRGVSDDSGVAKAHSGAIYVNVGGQPTLLKEDIELMIRWIDRFWALLEERQNFGPGNNREVAQADVRAGQTAHGRQAGEGTVNALFTTQPVENFIRSLR